MAGQFNFKSQRGASRKFGTNPNFNPAARAAAIEAQRTADEQSRLRNAPPQGSTVAAREDDGATGYDSF